MDDTKWILREIRVSGRHRLNCVDTYNQLVNVFVGDRAFTK
jgi:hypothetical protein